MHGWKLDYENFIHKNLFLSRFGKTAKYLILENFRLYGIHWTLTSSKIKSFLRMSRNLHFKNWQSMTRCFTLQFHWIQDKSPKIMPAMYKLYATQYTNYRTYLTTPNNPFIPCTTSAICIIHKCKQF